MVDLGLLLAGVTSPSFDRLTVEQMLLRWIHFLAGITWIGLLYFFNLVNVPFMKEMDAPTKSKVFPALMKRALFWFRWSALLTVVAGIWYWMTIIGADVRNAHAMAKSADVTAGQAQQFAAANGGMAIGSFLALWTAAFAICFVVVCVMKVNSAIVVGITYAVSVTAVAVVFVLLNRHGWESSRLISIGIGGGMGWMMLLNVWGVIWRFQKKLIRWTEENTASGTAMPAIASSLAKQSFLTSRANFALSVPMLFFMGAASHFPMWG
jgi:uncharacterized membrane protein